MKRKSITLLLLIALNVEVVQAQFWKPLTNAAGSVLNTGIKVATAPARTIINTGRVITGNARPGEIFRPYQEIPRSVGQSTQAVTEAVTDPQKFLFNRAQNFASQVGGKPGEFIFDVTTFTNQIYNELAISGLHNASGILQGQNPLQLFATPLAAGIRAARERHVQNARPLPDDVKAALKDHFNESTLNRAKYSVGNVQITLPNFIGQGAKLFGEDGYAVVADDIIIFNTPPPSYKDDPFWWAHEMTHVQQYEQLGVEGFAYKYLMHPKGVEAEANNKASEVTKKRPKAGTFQLQTGSFDMTGANYGIDYQQNPEFYIAQCIFPADPYRVNYLVTNYGRIVAVDPLTGNWLHIGFATPPLIPGFAWTYQTPNWGYVVTTDGRIFNAIPFFNPYGQIVGFNYFQVGHVIRLG